MDLKGFGSDVLGCVEINEEKLSELIIDKVVLHSLKKVVEDSSNPFDDQAYAMLAPLVAPKIKEVLASLIHKVEVK